MLDKAEPYVFVGFMVGAKRVFLKGLCVWAGAGSYRVSVMITYITMSASCAHTKAGALLLADFVHPACLNAHLRSVHPSQMFLAPVCHVS